MVVAVLTGMVKDCIMGGANCSVCRNDLAILIDGGRDSNDWAISDWMLEASNQQFKFGKTLHLFGSLT